MAINIDDIEYEMQIDHMTRSGVQIAVDWMRGRTDKTWVLAVVYGEAWAALKVLFEQEDFPKKDVFIVEARMRLIWQDFFPGSMPDILYYWDTAPRDVDIDILKFEEVRRKIAKHILDQVYDVVEVM